MPEKPTLIPIPTVGISFGIIPELPVLPKRTYSVAGNIKNIAHILNYVSYIIKKSAVRDTADCIVNSH